MSNMKRSAPDVETPHQSSPDPLTSGQFPEPYAEYHTLLSGSQGDNASRLNNVNVPIRTFMTYSTANRQMPIPLRIEFQNLGARMELAPTMPPPAYGQICAPHDANTPRTVATETCLNTGRNSREVGPSFTTRTTIVPQNVHNANKKTRPAWQIRLLICFIIIVIIAIVALKLLIAGQIRDQVLSSLH